ncbi:MAG: TrkA family potassium uptake protein [Trueperella sp.]|nr:TrkA family potassium uptake protein [Trueperella sp.]
MKPFGIKSSDSSVVVIGLGRFGSALADELERSGVEVLAIDNDPAVVARHSEELANVICADGTDAEALKQLSVPDFTTAVVAINHDLAASVLCASILLKMGGVKVWAEADSLAQGQIFDQLGVHRVFYPQAEMGRRAAHVISQELLDYMELGYGFALVQTLAPKAAVGRTLGEAHLRGEKGITVLAVRSQDGEWVNAHSETMISADDVLLIVGPSAGIGKLTAS